MEKPAKLPFRSEADEDSTYQVVCTKSGLIHVSSIRASIVLGKVGQHLAVSTCV